ncbi:MAG: hypothetical protein ABWX90_03650, partial [Candidatus Saccharimonadales bacterium]
MLRDLLRQLRDLRDFFAELSPLERTAYAITFVIVPIILLGLINLAPIYWGVKLSAAIVVAMVTLGLLTIVYSSSRAHKDTGSEMESGHHIDDVQIPPRPIHPPTITAERQYVEIEDEFEAPQESHKVNISDNPSLYRHGFSLIPVVFKTSIVAIGWVCLLLASLGVNTSGLWIAFVIATIVAPLYCYYIALRWNGEEFI